MALVMVLMIALNWPFRGEVGITPEPFKAVQENIKVQQLACWGRRLAAGPRRPAHAAAPAAGDRSAAARYISMFPIGNRDNRPLAIETTSKDIIVDIFCSL
jgi:hypothetical protein